MPDFGQIFDPAIVAILPEASKETAFSTLFDLIEENNKVPDITAFRDAIFHREKLMSTGIGIGIAMPHARLEKIKKPFAAFEVIKQGVKNYEAIDGLPVNFICMIGCASGQHKEYLKIMAEIVKQLKRQELRDALLNCSKPQDVHTLLLRAFDV